MIRAGEFILRAYQDADAAEMAAAVRESSETVGRWMTWAKPDFSEYDALCWFATCQTARSTGSGHQFGIFTSDGHFVGGCGLNQFSAANKLCNLGYWVRQSAQRRNHRCRTAAKKSGAFSATQVSCGLRAVGIRKFKCCCR